MNIKTRAERRNWPIERQEEQPGFCLVPLRCAIYHSPTIPSSIPALSTHPPPIICNPTHLCGAKRGKQSKARCLTPKRDFDAPMVSASCPTGYFGLQIMPPASYLLTAEVLVSPPTIVAVPMSMPQALKCPASHQSRVTSSPSPGWNERLVTPPRC